MENGVQIDLSGKSALITGGSMRMGLGVAQSSIKCRANVTICSNDHTSLSKASESLGSQDRILGIFAGVSVESNMKDVVAQTASKFGGLDIHVNSAGVQRYGTIVDTFEETWDEVMNVNLKGIYCSAKHAIPEIEKRGGGAIINLAFVQTFRIKAIVPTMGTGFELTAIAASVIGGAALSGGIESVSGAVTGALLFALIENIIILTQIDANWFRFAVGVMIVIAVMVNKFTLKVTANSKV